MESSLLWARPPWLDRGAWPRAARTTSSATLKQNQRTRGFTTHHLPFTILPLSPSAAEFQCLLAGLCHALVTTAPTEIRHWSYSGRQVAHESLSVVHTSTLVAPSAVVMAYYAESRLRLGILSTFPVALDLRPGPVLFTPHLWTSMCIHSRPRHRNEQTMGNFQDNLLQTHRLNEDACPGPELQPSDEKGRGGE